MIAAVLKWIGAPAILPWLLLSLAVAFPATFYGAKYLGRIEARQECQTATLENRIQTLERDLEVQRNVSARAQEDQAAITERARAAEEIIREYEQATTAGRDACAVDDDLLRRLRELGRPDASRPAAPR